MAVAINSNSVAVRGAGTSVSFSYACSSGANRLFLCGTRTTSGQTFDSGTYAGSALTNRTNSGVLKTWSITAPATGSNTVSFTMSAYSTGNHVGIADFTGVDQTTPLGTASSATGTSGTASTASITCPSGGMNWGIEANDYVSSGTPTAGSGTTLAGAFREGSGGTGMAGGYRSNTGAINLVPGGAPAWRIVGYPINAVPSVSLTLKRRTLLNLLRM